MPHFVCSKPVSHIHSVFLFDISYLVSFKMVHSMSYFFRFRSPTNTAINSSTSLPNFLPHSAQLFLSLQSHSGAIQFATTYPSDFRLDRVPFCIFLRTARDLARNYSRAAQSFRRFQKMVLFFL